MRQRAAGRCDDCHHALRLQLGQFGRCHVVADQDVAGYALGAADAFLQMGMDAADDVVQVIDATLEVGIIHAVEHCRQAVALQAQGIVGGVTAGADQFIQAVQQFRVIQQQCMQV